MSVREYLAAWRRGTEGMWSDRHTLKVFQSGLDRGRGASQGFSGAHFSDLYGAVIARGPGYAEPYATQAAELMPMLMANRREEKSAIDLELASMANLLACCGHSDETLPAADWIWEIEVDRNNHPSMYWERASAALALDVKPLYRALAGHEPDQPLPFAPGARFGGNLQGFLAHLGGAVETGAPFEAVRPAWDEFLDNLDRHHEANEMGKDSLFWIARVVGHCIAGQPLGTVAQWFHDYLVERAAQEAP